MRVAVVWWARRQRRCISPLRFFLFCRGIPLAAGAPAAGAQSSPEGRPFEPRPRLCNSGALVSLVPLDLNPADRRAPRPIINGATWPGVSCVTTNLLRLLRGGTMPYDGVWPVPGAYGT